MLASILLLLSFQPIQAQAPKNLHAFILKSRGIPDVCYENIKATKQAFLNKYTYLSGVALQVSAWKITPIKKCPPKALAFCDASDKTRQYFYKESTRRGSDNKIVPKRIYGSKKICEEKNGKWKFIK